MNELPEPDDDRSLRHLLAESGTGESPELLEGLRRLRSFRAAPAPKPTGELAALLAEKPVPPRQRPQRHRGLIMSFALAGAMAAGTTGVAANNDLRLATDSFCADLIEQVLPVQGTDDEQQPPAETQDEYLGAAGDAAAETGAGDAGGDPAASGMQPAPEADAGGYVAAAETPQPADDPLPPPAVVPEPAVEPEPAAVPEAPVIPEEPAVVPEAPVIPEEPGKSGGVHPGEGRAADGGDHPGQGGYGPGNQGPSGGPGQGRGPGGPAGNIRDGADLLGTPNPAWHP